MKTRLKATFDKKYCPANGRKKRNAACRIEDVIFYFPEGNIARLAGEEPGKYFLLIDNMLVVLGFFVVFSRSSLFALSIKWVGCRNGRDRARPAPVYSTRFGIFGGANADRFGAKPMIVTGGVYARRRLCHYGYRACFLLFVVFPAFFPSRRRPRFFSTRRASALVVKLTVSG